MNSSADQQQRLTWKSKYEQIHAAHVTDGVDDPNSPESIDGVAVEFKNGDMAASNASTAENGEMKKKSNVLVGLSGYLSSSDDEESSSDGEDSDLNGEVDAFLREVDNIYAEKRSSLPSKPPTPAASEAKPVEPNPTQQEKPQGPPAPTVAWQECYDSSTGFAYYWNVETNEVTWDMPIEYQMYLEAMKQWQQFQAQAEVAALMERARNQQIQHQLQQQQQLQLQQQQMLIQQVQESAAANKQAADLKAAKLRAKAKRRRKRRLNSKTDKSESEDDEKIELITSYGPNSADESDSEHEPPPPPVVGPMIPDKLPAEVRRRKKLQKLIKETAKKNSAENAMMGPQLPFSRTGQNESSQSSLVPYKGDDSDHDDGKEPISTRLVTMTKGAEKKQDQSPKVEEDDEFTLLDRLRSQTQVLQDLGGEIPEDIKSIITHTDKGSLVPSYSEGSADEDDKSKLHFNAKEPKTLKPPQIGDDVDGQQLYEPEEASRSPSSRADSPEPSESLPAPKRKFKLEVPLLPKKDIVLPESGKDDLKGLGFTTLEPSTKKSKTDKIMFVKAETLQFQNAENKAAPTVQDFVRDDTKDPNIDINDISGVLLDKMKFLSAAKEPVSPVQAWTVQLETLLTAWESHNLKTSYFVTWLTSMTKELETLESTVAPEGWRCEWQRYDSQSQLSLIDFSSSRCV